MTTKTSAPHPVLIDGQWRPAQDAGFFRAENPATGEALPDEYPVSTWADCEAALAAAANAAPALRAAPRRQIADFLTRYANRIEQRADEIAGMASLETGLAKAPRLAEVELPRTTGQLRQAATAAAEGSWALPTIDTKINLRSCYEAIGTVWVLGPNNFPLAYNSVAGGDFAAAIAAGNPVIAKSHPSHPGTTCLLAWEAALAARESGLPGATVQMLCHIQNEDGLRLLADHRLAAVAFTGSRAAGLRLKAAADAAGKPAYLEMSSLNPVIILPGALAERGAEIAVEYAASVLLASGQMCTKPGLALLMEGPGTDTFLAVAKQKFETTHAGPLLSGGVARNLRESVKILEEAGARVVTVAGSPETRGYRFPNMLLRVSGAQFLAEPERLQTEAFGNASLCVIADRIEQVAAILARFDGNLTGSIYSHTQGADDAMYERIAPLVRARVGRFLDDKMPTGVAVSPAMNHGGPYPATGHPGFTAVGVPASIRRFAMLACYDRVRPAHLPELLRDEPPEGQPWRLINGAWIR